MSLQSLQDDMSRRASSMANMAKQINDPQQIQAIQQSLVVGVQNGSIESYVGIPLIEELTKKLSEVNAQMAQNMAGMGMQQGEQAPQQPIGERVMQQAMQESQGLEALPSNLPQEYASGGIIAFEHGGEVQHFETGDLVDERFRSEKKRLDEEAQNEFRADVDPLDRFKFATKDRERRLSHADEAALDARAIREANEQAAAEAGAASNIKKVDGNTVDLDPPIIKEAPPRISEASPENANNSAPAAEPGNSAPTAEPVKTINPKSIQGMVKQYQDMMTAIPKGASQTEYEAYLKNRPKEAEAAKQQDLLMALAQYGSNLAAGKSRNFFQNVGEAGIKTLPAVQEAYKQRRIADEMALRGRAELDRMSRAEQIEALKGGVNLYGTERQLEADATKAELQRANALEVARLQNQHRPTDLMNHVKAYVAAKRREGSTESEEALALKGFQTYPGYVVKENIAGLQARVQEGAQALTTEQLRQQATDIATDNFSKTLENRKDPITIESNRLKRLDAENRDKGTPTNLQLEHKNKIIKDNADSMMPSSQQRRVGVPPPVVPSSRLNALPPGAVYKGTSGGKKVYQTPDGKQYIQD